jgi:hypothetical protein
MRRLLYSSSQFVETDLCEQSNCRDESQVVFIRLPSLGKDRLFEHNKYICHEIGAVHFGVIWESVDKIEAAGIPYNRKHKLFALNFMSRFCG